MGLSTATPGDLIRASYGVLRRSWVPSLVYSGLVGGAGFAIDINDCGERGGYAFLSGLNWAAGYVLLVFMARDAQLFTRGQQRGVWSYMGLSLLSGFAILLSLSILVVPGVIVLLRWLPSYAILLAEGGGIVGSLTRSWRVTRGHTSVLLWASWPALLAFTASMAFYVVGDEIPDGGARWTAYAVANGSLVLATLTWTALGVAVYRYVVADE
jgi:hypothetical protein